MQNLVGHIVELSRDQLSSKIIVTKLETASSDEKKLVFDEILPEMLPLPTDMFVGCTFPHLTLLSLALEKCIVLADDNERHWLSNEILRLEPEIGRAHV